MNDNQARSSGEDAADKPQSLHQRIQSEMETKILSGQWHTGFRLPTETELAEHYGCSRITVSKVLMILGEKGLVESRKRAGSFVRRPPAQSIILQILDPQSVAKQADEPYRYEMLDRIIRSPNSEDYKNLRLSNASDSEVLIVRCRHFIGGQVHALEDRMFSLGMLEAARFVDFSQRPPTDWLIEYLPWRSGDTFIRSEEATKTIAGLVGLAAGAALLTIERQVHAQGVAVSWGKTWHPSHAMALRAHYSTSATKVELTD